MIFKRIYVVLFLIILGQFVFLIYFLSPYLNNLAAFEYIRYSATDMEFAARAMIFSYEGDFDKAFANGVRLPLYPLILSIFIDVFDKPFLAIKVFQVFLSVLIIPIAFFILKKLLKNDNHALIGTIPFCLWFPFYYFSPILIVESVSIFFSSLLIFVIIYSTKENIYKISILVGLLLAIMTMFKSNNAVLFLPFVIYTFFLLRYNILQTIKISIVSVLTFIVFIAPWSIYISSYNNAFIPFSVLGPNAIIYGMGQKIPPGNKTLMDKVIKKYDIYNPEISKEVKENVKKVLDTNRYADLMCEMLVLNINPYVHKEHLLSKEYFSLKTEIGGKNIKEGNRRINEIIKNEWSVKGKAYAMLGISKIMHGLGMSFRNIIDFTIFFLFLFTIIGSIFLLYDNNLYQIVFYYYSMIFIYMFQSFLVYGDQKYRVVLIDFIMVLMFSIILVKLYKLVQLRVLK